MCLIFLARRQPDVVAALLRALRRAHPTARALDFEAVRAKVDAKAQLMFGGMLAV